MLYTISILFNGFLQGRNKADCILQQTTVAIIFVWIFYDIMGQVINESMLYLQKLQFLENALLF